MIKDPELLKLAVKAIEAEPERWDQRSWAMGAGKEGTEGIDVRDEAHGLAYKMLPVDMEMCGTTMCLAGHVVTQAGLPLLSHGWPGEKRILSSCLDENGNRRSIEDKAQELLGLSDEQSIDLFGCITDDLAVFKQRITQVTGVEFE